MTYSASPVIGLRVFIVEDETLIALMLETMLEELGCIVLGVAGSVAEALRSLDGPAAQADAAILDINIGGEKVYPVADALGERGVPYLFATGYGREGLGELYPRRIVLPKPYTQGVLAQALVELRAQSG
ncbi:response regulator [Phenylobacterium aquaticum]|uniref:response regulator n=1 Tax=Phenylobacterium aquaticum TaxID=1763816 RepID=UPI001F5CF0F7|nr:response regulator [Phenylobacterium aquaticum]MCI3133161.1 response regulator [Phenylobacterium aquaticum]